MALHLCDCVKKSFGSKELNGEDGRRVTSKSRTGLHPCAIPYTHLFGNACFCLLCSAIGIDFKYSHEPVHTTAHCTLAHVLYRHCVFVLFLNLLIIIMNVYIVSIWNLFFLLGLVGFARCSILSSLFACAWVFFDHRRCITITPTCWYALSFHSLFGTYQNSRSIHSYCMCNLKFSRYRFKCCLHWAKANIPLNVHIWLHRASGDGVVGAVDLFVNSSFPPYLCAHIWRDFLSCCCLRSCVSASSSHS